VLALSSGLITREHLARDLPRAPGDDRLNGLIADVFAGNVIDGLEPPPVVLDFQTHLGAPIFRYAAHARARLPRVRFQAVVSFFFVHDRISSFPSFSLADRAVMRRASQGKVYNRAHRHPLPRAILICVVEFDLP
jgi:hypothetical protein